MNHSIIINETEILIATFENEKYVAVKPICDALGVSVQKQLEKIKNDEILSSVITLRVTTGADGKQYEMQMLPLRFVFGWLFTINPKNVKPDSKEGVINYKLECYNALFDTFTKRNTILQEKTKYQLEIEAIEEDLRKDDRFKRIQELKSNIKEASTLLNAMDKGIVNEQLDLFKK